MEYDGAPAGERPNDNRYEGVHGQHGLRTSSFAFKGQQKEIPAIARELNVRMVLEGSVRKQDDRVRITAQLVDAHSRPARHNAVTRHN